MVVASLFQLTSHPVAQWDRWQLPNALPFVDSRATCCAIVMPSSSVTTSKEQVQDIGTRRFYQPALALAANLCRKGCDESSLRRIVASYLEYYYHSRTDLSSKKDSPCHHRVEQPTSGQLCRYVRLANCTPLRTACGLKQPRTPPVTRKYRETSRLNWGADRKRIPSRFTINPSGGHRICGDRIGAIACGARMNLLGPDDPAGVMPSIWDNSRCAELTGGCGGQT
jgi:hypothetical protein